MRAIDALERALRRQRDILRQIGDTLAWIVLQMEPALLIPLWAQGEHQVPTGIGLGDQLLVTNALHDSGLFLCVETDLTRCLDIGDIVIVPHGRDWTLPLCVELKSSGKLELGQMVDIEAHLTLAERGESQRIFADIKRLLNLQDDL